MKHCQTRLSVEYRVYRRVVILGDMCGANPHPHNILKRGVILVEMEDLFENFECNNLDPMFIVLNCKSEEEKRLAFQYFVYRGVSVPEDWEEFSKDVYEFPYVKGTEYGCDGSRYANDDQKIFEMSDLLEFSAAMPVSFSGYETELL